MTIQQFDTFAAAFRDYRAVGLQKSAATTHARNSPKIAYHQQLSVPLATSGDIVALVPTNKESRSLLTQNAFYGRVTSLGQRISLETRYIGYMEHGSIEYLYPIIDRILVGSAAAIHSNPTLAARIPNAWKNLAEPAHLFRLNTASRIHLGLLGGFTPTQRNPFPGLPGVRHHRLGDLQTASTLKGLASV